MVNPNGRYVHLSLVLVSRRGSCCKTAGLSLMSHWYVKLIIDEDMLADAQPCEIRHGMSVDIVSVLLVLATIVTDNTFGVMMALQRNKDKSFTWIYLKLYRTQRNETKAAISKIIQITAIQSYRGVAPTRKA